MSNTLPDLIDREELKYVQLYIFPEEGGARRVYSAMLGDYVPVPLKSAVALVRPVSFDWWGVVLFMGRSFRIPEMPKPIDMSFSWDEYLKRLGLPRQSEWKQWSANTFPGFARAFEGVVIVDYFLSPGLKGAGYRCLACDESFATYDELFDGHVYRGVGHDRDFNAAVLARLPQEAVAEGDTPDAALDAARSLVPPNAEVLEERTTERTTKRGQPTGSSKESVERAFEDARRWVPTGARVLDERVSQCGWTEEINLKLQFVNRDPDSSSVLTAIRSYLRSSDMHDTPFDRIAIEDHVCVRRGSPGILGIGRRPAEYRVRLAASWEVIIEYESVQPSSARIRYRPSRNTGW